MNLRWIVCAVSLGGLLFGFDSGVISGCEEAIQNEFALAPFWHGLVVAGALIGTVFGALAAGRRSICRRRSTRRRRGAAGRCASRRARTR